MESRMMAVQLALRINCTFSTRSDHPPLFPTLVHPLPSSTSGVAAHDCDAWTGEGGTSGPTDKRTPSPSSGLAEDLMPGSQVRQCASPRVNVNEYSRNRGRLEGGGASTRGVEGLVSTSID